ncbi:MAG: hypothetical protein ABSH20_15040 [Tepidisphaeraceae bacterium]
MLRASVTKIPRASPPLRRGGGGGIIHGGGIIGAIGGIGIGPGGMPVGRC